MLRIGLMQFVLLCSCASTPETGFKISIEDKFFDGKVMGTPDATDDRYVLQANCTAPVRIGVSGVLDYKNLKVTLNDKELKLLIIKDGEFNIYLESESFNKIKICHISTCQHYFVNCVAPTDELAHSEIQSQTEIGTQSSSDQVHKEERVASTKLQVDNSAQNAKLNVQSQLNKSPKPIIQTQNVLAVSNETQLTENKISAPARVKEETGELMDALEERPVPEVKANNEDLEKEKAEKRKAQIDVLDLMAGDMNLFFVKVKDIRDHLKRIEVIAKDPNAMTQLNNSISNYNVTHNQIEAKKTGISELIQYYWSEDLSEDFEEVCSDMLTDIHKGEILSLNNSVFAELLKRSQGKRVKMKKLKEMAASSVASIDRQIETAEPKLKELINNLKE